MNLALTKRKLTAGTPKLVGRNTHNTIQEIEDEIKQCRALPREIHVSSIGDALEALGVPRNAIGDRKEFHYLVIKERLLPDYLPKAQPSPHRSGKPRKRLALIKEVKKEGTA